MKYALRNLFIYSIMRSAVIINRQISLTLLYNKDIDLISFCCDDNNKTTASILKDRSKRRSSAVAKESRPCCLSSIAGR